MKLNDCLSREERAHFRTLSDTRAVGLVLANLAVIAAAFALFGLWPHPVTFVVCTVILGGRIVGLGILNHDAAHNSLFRTRALNRRVARWLFASPLFLEHDAYRDGHLRHHKHAGTVDDPDLPFVKSYPVERASMRRKLLRDLSGRTGLRDMLYLVAMSVRHLRWRPFAVHGLTFGALYLAGIPHAYALYWAAMIFVVPVCLRIRVIGEHGNVPDLLGADVRDHARTTRAGWLGRALIAPNYVNYHCEHHLFANVPGYKLPELHALLSARGFYDDHPRAVAGGYLEVLRACVGVREPRPELDGLTAVASFSNMS